ncbi:Lipopolysaccharide-induced tumor necrosis factor-alpha factor [Paragonimus heterotremus]|uniref:Lipopolysaccharide-induced tumor necrosis factor-alpha factor n=1 Tax=Paragonimus heterotremus TaxID=100268 RepID=A0A8J4SMJ4_9TREM|nr:Lipopolysaccharide-induced tumor necrosis factor-alpha factor [Paragonimus heterotremus]
MNAPVEPSAPYENPAFESEAETPGNECSAPPPYTSSITKSAVEGAATTLSFQPCPLPVQGSIKPSHQECVTTSYTTDTYPVQMAASVPYPTATVFITQHPLESVPKPQFSTTPVTVRCSSCNQITVTELVYKDGGLTWLICGALSLSGLLFGCCLIPFCCNSTRDVQHICPNCGWNVGIYRRL